MHYLPFLADMPYLYLVQGAFTIWMLVDANRRRVDTYWYWIILMFPGVGAWVYFFVVKVKDYRGGGGLSFFSFQRRPSLKELHYRVHQSPTLTSHLALAERLGERGDHAEAVSHLEAVLAQEPDHCRALYLLAVCQTGLGHPDLAVPHLEKVIARDRFWGNYKAWHLLVEARVQGGDAAGAVTACQELVRLAPTLQHKCLLAERLLDQGQNDEAWDMLEKGLGAK